ncbi:hypothetical protein DXG01_003429 [Tephrocybe rancida]|nr:hypothetical protein DXG01_003429 [Tephrocybe rancida]
MGREPESGGLGPEPKHLRHTGGKESAVESKLTEGGSLQMLVEVVHSALDGVLTPIPSDGKQYDADISGGTTPLEQTKIINQQMLMQMLKQGDLFSLAMAAQTTGGDDSDVKAEQGGSKHDVRGNAADSDSSSSSNKDDVEMGKDNGGKKDRGDPPDKKNDSAEGSAAKNGGVRKRNNAQDNFDILTQADRIRMEGELHTIRPPGMCLISGMPEEITCKIWDFLRFGMKLPASHRRLLCEVPKLMLECSVISKELSLHILGTTKGNFQCIWHHFGRCSDLTETTILPKPMVPGARLVVNSQTEKVPTRVKGRKTFKKHVFDPMTTEFTSPKMTPPVHTLLHHTLCSIADLSLDNFYLGPKYFKDNIPLTTPFPRYFSYEYQLEIARKAMKGLLAWIRYLNHILSKGETQLEAEDIEIWQEELSKEKIAARITSGSPPLDPC